MKMIVVFKFRVFNESIKQKATQVAKEFTGVTSVVEVEKEGHLEVRGEFNSFEMTKELKKIDETVHIIKIGQDEEKEQDKGKGPFNIQEVNKQSDDDAGRSNWTTSLQPYEWWEKAKVIGGDVAEKAKVIGVGVAEQAKVTGVGVVKQGGVRGFLKRRKAAEKIRLRIKWDKEEDLKQKKIWVEKMSKKQGTSQN